MIFHEEVLNQPLKKTDTVMSRQEMFDFNQWPPGSNIPGNTEQDISLEDVQTASGALTSAQISYSAVQETS